MIFHLVGIRALRFPAILRCDVINFSGRHVHGAVTNTVPHSAYLRPSDPPSVAEPVVFESVLFNLGLS